MKKYKLFVITFILFFSFQNFAYGWRDGYIGYPYANNPIDYNFATNYNTMDWIADGAMSKLLDYNPKIWKWLWNFQKYYFVGTEAISNENLLVILNKTEVIGIGDFESILIKYTNGHTLSSENIVQKITDIMNRSKTELMKRNYETASFYLGVLSSYISLLIYYPIFEVGTTAFWNDRFVFDEKISLYTSLYDDPEWFFIWYDYVPKVFVSSAILNTASSFAFNTTNNIFWLNDSAYVSEIPADYFELQTYGKTNITYRFYTHMEFVLNKIIQLIVDAIYTVFTESGAEGGNINPTNILGRMDSRSKIIIISVIGSASLVTLIVWKRKSIKNYFRKVKN